jgi:predicted homoserine dehydrogenase-like protein
MHIIDRKLESRQIKNDPIKVGIVGAGAMAMGLTNQISRYMRGMRVQGIYNRTQSRAVKMCHVAGYNNVIIAKSELDFEAAHSKGIPAITDNLEILLGSSYIDVIVEVTGNVSFGLQTILAAFENNKHVVSFNAELEATLGPFIKLQAEKHGVKYTLADGDQPGVTLNLWRHVKMMGFDPLLCGNIKGMEDRYRTPATQAVFAEKWGQSQDMVTSFADGTKLSFEQACIANATNMSVAKRGMIGLKSQQHIDHLVKEYDITELKAMGGVVDYVVGAKPGPGVFVYATTEDPLSIKYLKYGKLGDGPLYSFYIPYHLLFFELAFSIVRLIDYDDITLDAEFGLKVEVITIAKDNLTEGTVLDGVGGYHSYGICEKSEMVQKEALLPMGLSEGCTLKRHIGKDQPITFDDVEIDNKYSKFTHYFEQINTSKQLVGVMR